MTKAQKRYDSPSEEAFSRLKGELENCLQITYEAYRRAAREDDGSASEKVREDFRRAFSLYGLAVRKGLVEEDYQVLLGITRREMMVLTTLLNRRISQRNRLTEEVLDKD